MAEQKTGVPILKTALKDKLLVAGAVSPYGKNLSSFDFTNSKFNGKDGQKELRNYNFNDSLFLETAVFNYKDNIVDFEGSTFNKATFKGVFMGRDTRFVGCHFKQATITRGNFSETNLSHTNFDGAKLTDSNFSKTNLSNTKFDGAKLTNSNFSETNLSNTNFDGAELTKANFGNTNLTGARFAKTTLKNVDFSKANFDHATLDQVVTDEATQFSGCQFMSATIKDTAFMNSNMPNTIFDNAKLTNVNFDKTNLTGARFTKTTTLKNVDFSKAIGFEITKNTFPDRSLDELNELDKTVTFSPVQNNQLNKLKEEKAFEQLQKDSSQKREENVKAKALAERQHQEKLDEMGKQDKAQKEAEEKLLQRKSEAFNKTREVLNDEQLNAYETTGQVLKGEQLEEFNKTGKVLGASAKSNVGNEQPNIVPSVRNKPIHTQEGVLTGFIGPDGEALGINGHPILTSGTQQTRILGTDLNQGQSQNQVMVGSDDRNLQQPVVATETKKPPPPPTLLERMGGDALSGFGIGAMGAGIFIALSAIFFPIGLAGIAFLGTGLIGLGIIAIGTLAAVAVGAVLDYLESRPDETIVDDGSVNTHTTLVKGLGDSLNPNQSIKASIQEGIVNTNMNLPSIGTGTDKVEINLQGMGTGLPTNVNPQSTDNSGVQEQPKEKPKFGG